MMITKVLFSLAVGLTFTNAASLTDDTLTCYNCGYLQLTNGTKIPLKEEYGDIPFCNDFASDEGMTVPAMIGGCCSAFKIEITDEQSGETMWISRHGTANDEDELIFNDFVCGETTNDYICKDEHIDSKDINQDARVCHCFEDKCNKEVPQPDPTATPDPGPGPGPATTCQTTCTTTCTNGPSAFIP